MRFNKITKPEECPDFEYSRKIEGQQQLVFDIFNVMNNNKFSPEIFRMTMYEIVVKKFIESRFFKQPNYVLNEDKFIEVIIDYQAHFLSKIHFTNPSLGLKEIAIAHCLSMNVLFLPQHPDTLGDALDEASKLRAFGIHVNEQNIREDYKHSIKRVETWCHILFVQFRDSAYLGRAWQYLVLYLNMKKFQLQS